LYEYTYDTSHVTVPQRSPTAVFCFSTELDFVSSVKDESLDRVLYLHYSFISRHKKGIVVLFCFPFGVTQLRWLPSTSYAWATCHEAESAVGGVENHQSMRSFATSTDSLLICPQCQPLLEFDRTQLPTSTRNFLALRTSGNSSR